MIAMMLRGRVERLIGCLAGAGLLAACGGQAVGPAAYGPEQCRRVLLVDEASGAPVIGAEDLAFDAAHERLFVSAYDRRAAEKAARARAATIPEGGLYALDLSALGAGAGEVRARSLVAAGDLSGGVRPHGIAYDAQAEELVFINRAYEKRDGRWRMTAGLERIGANGEVYVGARHAAPCGANSLVLAGDKTYVSFDHRACGWRAGLEDVLALKRSGLAEAGGQTVFGEAAFANGAALMQDGSIVLAATREKALLVMAPEGEGLAPAKRLSVPGGPDNLTIAEDGAIVAALHPSLMRMGVHRRLGLGAAPSRIVRVDPEDGAVSILFDDPSGEVFSGATVALEAGGLLVAGSATDAGLLVCGAQA